MQRSEPKTQPLGAEDGGGPLDSSSVPSSASPQPRAARQSINCDALLTLQPEGRRASWRTTQELSSTRVPPSPELSKSNPRETTPVIPRSGGSGQTPKEQTLLPSQICDYGSCFLDCTISKLICRTLKKHMAVMAAREELCPSGSSSSSSSTLSFSASPATSAAFLVALAVP